MSFFKYSLFLSVLLTLVACDSDKGSQRKDTIDDNKTSSKTQNEELIPLIMPSLFSILLAAEEKKGSPLTEKEVLNIRDNSPSIMTPKHVANALTEKRGYEDLAPENVWNEWLIFREQRGFEVDVDGGAHVLDNPSDNPDMRVAEKKARATLDQFRQLIKSSSEINPLIKVRLEEENTSARMWLIVDDVQNESFKAHLFEVPSDFEEHQAGDRFDIQNKEVLDWMFNNEGEVSGAFTIRVQRASMSESERKEMDEYMGVTHYKIVTICLYNSRNYNN
ncbi:MAG: DUF2314 domain-containing protein [Cocleimonas sp.]